MTKHYRGYNSVIEASYFVHERLLPGCSDVVEITLLNIKLAGCLGIGRVTELPLSMKTTEVMSGLSATFS